MSIFSGMTKLMLAGSWELTATVEVFSFDPANPGLICDNLPDLPIGLSGPAGSLLDGTTPTVCGRNSLEAKI